MSGQILLGKSGMKIAYQRGFSLPVAVFVSNFFQEKEPGLTMLVRHACQHGWEAASKDGLKGRGRKPSLLLKAAAEAGQGMRRVKSLTSAQFVAWLTHVSQPKPVFSH